MDQFASKLQCGFRKKYSAQCFFFAVLEEWIALSCSIVFLTN